MITIILDDQELQLMLDKGEKFFGSPKDLLAKASTIAHSNILKRTAAGKDFDNKFFAPYSYAYALQRMESGRPTAKVDLFFTGKMLAALKTKTTSKKSTLYFASKHERDKAVGVHYGNKFNKTQRKFFMVSAKDMEEIQKMILDETQREVID